MVVVKVVGTERADTLWTSEMGERRNKDRTRTRHRREREAEDDGGHRIEVKGAENTRCG